MRIRIFLAPVLLALMLSACGQKGALYIPPEQQSPASQPPEAGVTAADSLDQELEEAERAPAETQDAQTLEEGEAVEDGEDGL